MEENTISSGHQNKLHIQSHHKCISGGHIVSAAHLVLDVQ